MDSTLPDTRQHDHELTVADLKFNRPELSEQSLVELAGDCFGVSGTLQALAGERDQNSRITTSDGSQFVLKISGAGEDPQTVDFQVKALQHIEQKDPGIPVPRVVAGKDGAMVQKIRRADGEHMVRLLTWLPGIPYEAGPTPSLAALHQVGVFIARLNQALEGFSHAAAEQYMPWDICNGLIFNQQLQGLLPVQTRELIGPALNRLECDVYPQLPGLRAQVIHQDGHGGNLLRRAQDSEEVSGVIDFGDMIHGPLISDLAVCASHSSETKS